MLTLSNFCYCLLIMSGIIFFLPKRYPYIVLHLSLIFSVLLFNYSLFFFIKFFSFVDTLFSDSFFVIWPFIPEVVLELDGLSAIFVVLTTALLPPALLYSYNYLNHINLKIYICLLWLLNFSLLLLFLTSNLFVFFICFEVILLPIFGIIILFGSQSRKILASFYFFFYTFFGSLFFLFALLIIYSEIGSFQFNILFNYTFSYFSQIVLWPCVAIAFITKVPMVPFHLWLPEAHVEAPTVGSVYLASILLKLGVYGFLKILFPLFPLATVVYSPFMQSLALISVIYSSIIILRQIDLKKIIAYSSIVHMNFGIFGLFSYVSLSLHGVILLMLAHGITSGALFFLIGMLYDRYQTRLILYYSGLARVMPIFSFLFLFFSLCNIGFPGTMNFMAEILLFLGIIIYSLLTKNVVFILLISAGIFSSLCYSMWLVNKLIFGNLRSSFFEKNCIDLGEREILVLIPFICLILIFGFSSYLVQTWSFFIIKILQLFI